jgi:glycosyltransferase involved in cell wall biosynthesis
LKIGINTLFMIPHEVGGTETYLREITKALTLIGGSHRFVVFTNADNDALIRSDLGGRSNVEFVRLAFSARFRPERVLREQFQLPLLARRSGVDVLWSPGNAAPLFGFCPQVVTIHDMQYKSHADDLSGLEHWVIDFLVQQSVRRCARVLTPSVFSKDEVIRFTSVNAASVFAIKSGVHPTFGAAVTGLDVDTRMAGINGLRPPYMLCVANSYPHKNLNELVLAFAQLESTIPHQLVMVGQARRGESRLQHALEGLKDQTRVIRLKGLDSPTLAALYQQSELVVFPSLYEGFGLPVLEAMLAKVPVVTTRCGSIPEVGGDAAFYARSPDAVGLADAIRDVLAMSKELRAERVQAAFVHASTFTWERSASGILRVLEGVVG